jgi:hypothetical protein
MKLNEILSSSEELTRVYSTNNYNLFGFIGGNRNVNTSNLKKIKDSMGKKHIKTNAIICFYDENDSEKPLKIIDGQHRYHACVELNTPVTYIVDETLTLKTILNDITLLNTASKEWDVSDFMVSESEKGNLNYSLYSKVYNSYSSSFDHESLFFILNSDPNRTKSKISYPQFKSGDLEFDSSDYNYLLKRLEEISLFNRYSENGGKRYYQKALNRLMNTRGFDLNQMLSKLDIRNSTIEKCTTVEGALKQLSDIYNWKTQSGKILFLNSGNKIEEIIIK